MNASTVAGPWSPAARLRTDTVPSAISRSPATNMYGTFCSWASADLIPDLLLPVVQFGPQPGGREPVAHGGGVRRVAVGDRQHRRLHGRDPQRERARVVLEQQRHEALEAAENRAVNHDRPVRGVVRAHVREIEPLRSW